MSPRQTHGSCARMCRWFAPLMLVVWSAPAFAVNPVLPSWEYIPDAEPKVFGDRLYLYGSHDRAGSTSFCDYILKVWSAPLSDLTNWRDEGIALSTRDIGGHKDDIPWSDNQFYAPEVVEKDGKFYLYAQIVGDPCAVAVSDNPAGPFKLISRIEVPEGAPNDFGGWSQYFDPGVLVDDDGKVYIYWGGGRSFMAELNPQTMVDVLPQAIKEDIIPREPPFEFQEGCSPRKIDGTYYLVFAAGARLAYATSKLPTGPFAYGGTIVRNDRDYPGGNIHGSLVNVHGQWYITYHRMTHGTVFSRKVCAERVTIESDGSIKEVEQTSLGFQESLDPFHTTPAEIACVLKGGNQITELDPFTHAVIDNRSGSVIGYKYFDFGRGVVGQNMELAAQLRTGAASGQMEIWIDGDTPETGTKIGTLAIEPGSEGWRAVSTPVSNVTGRHAVYFRFVSDAADQFIADLRSFRFVKAE